MTVQGQSGDNRGGDEMVALFTVNAFTDAMSAYRRIVYWLSKEHLEIMYPFNQRLFKFKRRPYLKTFNFSDSSF